MERSLKDTPYERRIQRLMTGEDGDQYGFSSKLYISF